MDLNRTVCSGGREPWRELRAVVLWVYFYERGWVGKRDDRSLAILQQTTFVRSGAKLAAEEYTLKHSDRFLLA